MSKKITKLNSAPIVDDDTNLVNDDTNLEKAEKKSETALELAKRLEKEVAEYIKVVKSKQTDEELDEMEKELMAEWTEFDKYIKEREYVVPTSCVFEGKTYTKADVAGKIVYFISKSEQIFQYVYGLYELCKLWKSPTFEKISYGALDSTLRLLDQNKFRGMTEWRDILIVNEFMKPLHEDYSKDTTMQIARAQKHDAIVKQHDLINPVGKKEEECKKEEE